MSGQVLPGVTTISRHVQAAPGAAAHQLPGAADGLPESCKQDPGVLRIKAHVRGTCLRVLVKDSLPGLASVRGAVDSPLGIRSECMTQDRGKCDVGIGR